MPPTPRHTRVVDVRTWQQWLSLRICPTIWIVQISQLRCANGPGGDPRRSSSTNGSKALPDSGDGFQTIPTRRQVHLPGTSRSHEHGRPPCRKYTDQAGEENYMSATSTTQTRADERMRRLVVKQSAFGAVSNPTESQRGHYETSPSERRHSPETVLPTSSPRHKTARSYRSRDPREENASSENNQ